MLLWVGREIPLLNFPCQNALASAVTALRVAGETSLPDSSSIQAQLMGSSESSGLDPLPCRKSMYRSDVQWPIDGKSSFRSGPVV